MKEAFLDVQNEETSYIDKYFIHHQEYKDINSGIRFHNGYEFLYVRSGEVKIYADDKLFTARKNQGILFLPDTVHSYKTEDCSMSYMCVFSEKFIPDFVRIGTEKHARPFTVQYGDAITDMLKNAKDEFMQKGMLYSLVSMAYGTEENKDTESIPVDIADKILAYIEKNYTYDISLSDVAEDLNYQYNYLSKLINRIFKMNFSKLLNKYRIYTAQQLLRNKERTITETALNCGYSSVRSFNRNFKKITGFTPSEYIEDIKKY